MSRTFRCKGFEKTKNRSSDKEGSKTNGFYTNKMYQVTDDGHGLLSVYHPMTEKEQAKKFHKVHGESKHSNARKPARWFRKEFHLDNDRHNETQMRKYLNSNGDYDPVFIAKFPSQYDWWKMW